MANSSNISDIGKVSRSVSPAIQRRFNDLGQRVRLARLRRGMSMVEMAERTGISRDTLHRLERGDASISIATLLTVLSVVNLEAGLDLIGADDRTGRSLQDVALARRPRGIRRQDLVDFAERDWSAIAEVKSSQWLERKRRLGVTEAFRVADDLRRQVALTRPDWPDEAERSEDLASHVAVGDSLRSVRATGPR